MDDIERRIAKGLTELLGMTAESLTEALLECENRKKEGRRRYAEKVLIGITLGHLQEGFFSTDLYKKVAEIENLTSSRSFKAILIESFSPIPFLNVHIREDLAKEIIEATLYEIVNWVKGSKGELRMIAARGVVEDDVQGDSETFSRLGSSGSLVSNILQGCISLPKQHSWGNQEFIETMQIEPQQKVMISSEGFYPI